MKKWNEETFCHLSGATEKRNGFMERISQGMEASANKAKLKMLKTTFYLTGCKFLAWHVPLTQNDKELQELSFKTINYCKKP